jgi:hypothetical protein
MGEGGLLSRFRRSSYRVKFWRGAITPQVQQRLLDIGRGELHAQGYGRAGIVSFCCGRSYRRCFAVTTQNRAASLLYKVLHPTTQKE